MCFSKEVSLITFIIGFVSSVLLIKEKSITCKILGFFFLNVILVQLTEFLLWTHRKCDSYNKLISKLQILIINLQPVVLYLAINHFNKTKETKFIILLYLLFIIPFTFNALKQNVCDQVTNKHLDWQWTRYSSNSGMVYLLFAITIGLLGYYGLPSFGKQFAVLSVLSYLISGFIYKDYVGTMWCFFGALLPFFILLFKKFIG